MTVAAGAFVAVFTAGAVFSKVFAFDFSAAAVGAILTSAVCLVLTFAAVVELLVAGGVAVVLGEDAAARAPDAGVDLDIRRV